MELTSFLLSCTTAEAASAAVDAAAVAADFILSKKLSVFVFIFVFIFIFIPGPGRTCGAWGAFIFL